MLKRASLDLYGGVLEEALKFSSGSCRLPRPSGEELQTIKEKRLIGFLVLFRSLLDLQIENSKIQMNSA